MDRFAAMEIFVKTVEAGSFTAAADALSITPQSVGKQVAALEAHLGVNLIRRTTRRQYVSEAGWQFYEQCKTILDDVAAAEAQAAMTHATPRGLLRLSAPVSYGAHVLAPRLPDYLRAHPEVLGTHAKQPFAAGVDFKKEKGAHARFHRLGDGNYRTRLRLPRSSTSGLLSVLT